jgi:HAD superfamily phosphoserine phosphatase-like hydrolase
MRIAVFDLDGTVTRRDTLWPYLLGWQRRHPRAGFWPRVLGAVARYPLDPDRGRLKSHLIRIAMGGATRAEVRAWSADFVDSLGDGELCPGALLAIARHRAAGDRLVLLSASVDLYVPDIGRRLGFDETICTEVAWSGERLDGALESENRRGEGKRRCIEALRARHPGARITAYGNARSDFEHFMAVDEPVLVNARAALRRAAASRGYRVQEWRNKSPAAPVQSS